MYMRMSVNQARNIKAQLPNEIFIFWNSRKAGMSEVTIACNSKRAIETAKNLFKEAGNERMAEAIESKDEKKATTSNVEEIITIFEKYGEECISLDNYAKEELKAAIAEAKTKANIA